MPTLSVVEFLQFVPKGFVARWEDAREGFGPAGMSGVTTARERMRRKREKDPEDAVLKSKTIFYFLTILFFF